MPDSISQRQARIVEEFSLLEDWTDRYEHLIDVGEALPPLRDEFKTEIFRVRGCQSQVWLRPEFREGSIFFGADSDALITRGLVALLVLPLEGQPTAQVAAASFDFLDEIGLREHLSPTRKNGLAAMVARIKAYAESGSVPDFNRRTA